MITPLIYKLSTDDNGAPCVTEDFLSLAICKPGYRSVAKKGDFLFGFMGRSSSLDRSEPLIYIAEITEEPLPIIEYYTDPVYHNRPDCIYQYQKGDYAIREDAIYHNYLKGHSDRRDADLGKNRDQKVLLSKNFRYFGDRSEIIDKANCPELTKFVYNLGQTNYPPSVCVSVAIFDEATALQKSYWSLFSTMKIGAATAAANPSRDCGDGSEIVRITTC